MNQAYSNAPTGEVMELIDGQKINEDVAMDLEEELCDYVGYDQISQD